ncbi:MAG TPA: carboxypeptidase-like regulatory domain-containing protein [Flavipsychrobacter sp.]|nr:carboxypeptidase-like regulatory domain-containing protein [Flavipsychrobacter sp.]
MNKRQNAYLLMFEAVRNFCDDNTAVWTDKAYFAMPFNEFKAKIPLILDEIAAQSVPTTGITDAKNDKRAALITISDKIATAGRAYAVVSSNKPLKTKLDITHSDLVRARDNDVAGLCLRIYEHAQPLAASLEPYGIAADDFESLESLTSEFAAMIGDPEVAIGIKEDDTDNLEDLLKEALTILKERVDPAAKALKVFDEDFSDTYFNVRKVDDPSYTKLSLRVNVHEAGTSTPVGEAQILIPALSIKKDTTPLGNAQFKNLAEGTYEITISKPGYLPQTMPLYIVDGETVDMEVALQPV